MIFILHESDPWAWFAWHLMAKLQPWLLEEETPFGNHDFVRFHVTLHVAIGWCFQVVNCAWYVDDGDGLQFQSSCLYEGLCTYQKRSKQSRGKHVWCGVFLFLVKIFYIFGLCKYRYIYPILSCSRYLSNSHPRKRPFLWWLGTLAAYEELPDAKPFLDWARQQGLAIGAAWSNPQERP